MLRLDQLIAEGLTPRGVAHRVEAGRLFRLHSGVFATHPPPYSRHQLYLAAVYAGGPGSTLSDLPAAAVLRIFETSPLPAQITNRSGRGRSCRGIVVHRRKLDPRDVTVRHGIPCTTPARTILDCSRILDAEGTEELLMAADSLRILDRRRLEQLVEHHGSRHLRPLLSDDPQITRSRNERRLSSICRQFGIPRPETDHRIDTAGRTFYADFCWPELRLVVEADSWRWHGGRSATEYDRDRDQLLALADWRVVRFTRDQIVRRREETGRRLLALTASCRA